MYLSKIPQFKDTKIKVKVFKVLYQDKVTKIKETKVKRY